MIIDKKNEKRKKGKKEQRKEMVDKKPGKNQKNIIKIVKNRLRIARKTLLEKKLVFSPNFKMFGSRAF